MNWITIQNEHVNLDLVLGFYWGNGILTIVELNAGVAAYADPDKVWYNKVCSRVSLLPVERPEDGETDN